MSRRTTNKMHTKKRIFKYWDEQLKLSEQGLTDNHCMRCHFGSHDNDVNMVQRAHILSYFDGGADDSSNLHLLCSQCHTLSETLNGEAYWYWFNFPGRANMSTSISAAVFAGIFKSMGLLKSEVDDICEELTSELAEKMITQLALLKWQESKKRNIEYNLGDLFLLLDDYDLLPLNALF